MAKHHFLVIFWSIFSPVGFFHFALRGRGGLPLGWVPGREGGNGLRLQGESLPGPPPPPNTLPKRRPPRPLNEKNLSLSRSVFLSFSLSLSLSLSLPPPSLLPFPQFVPALLTFLDLFIYAHIYIYIYLSLSLSLSLCLFPPVFFVFPSP